MPPPNWTIQNWSFPIIIAAWTEAGSMQVTVLRAPWSTFGSVPLVMRFRMEVFLWVFVERMIWAEIGMTARYIREDVSDDQPGEFGVRLSKADIRTEVDQRWSQLVAFCTRSQAHQGWLGNGQENPADYSRVTGALWISSRRNLILHFVSTAWASDAA